MWQWWIGVEKDNIEIEIAGQKNVCEKNGIITCWNNIGRGPKFIGLRQNIWLAGHYSLSI